MGRVIGVCGLLGSGKGTVADYLVEKYGFEKLSFADKLKDGVAAVFDWDRELLEGVTQESREYREVPDEFLSDMMGRAVTPRLILQLFGTECMRKGIHDDIWVNLVKKTIMENPDKDYVIPDARFFNEQDMITDVGGEVWAVFRGEVPHWWGDAVEDNMLGSKRMEILEPDLHQSEYRWARSLTYYNKVLQNDSTLECLYCLVNQNLKQPETKV